MISKRYLAALAVTAACGCGPMAARADALDYSFLDVNYQHIVPQDTPGLQDGTGLELNGSYGLPANFTVVADFGRSTYDIQGQPSSFYEVSQGMGVGVGYHYALTRRVDLEAELDYVGDRAWVETPISTGPSQVSHGLGYDVGLRAMATDRLELHAFIGRSHINGTDLDDHGLSAGFVYDLTSSFGLGLSYHHDTADAPPNVRGQSSYTTHGTVFFARFQF